MVFRRENNGFSVHLLVPALFSYPHRETANPATPGNGEEKTMETRKLASRKALFGYAGAAAVIAIVAGLMVARPGSAIPTINQTADHVAIKGYDTVAYFTESKPVKGRAEYQSKWEDTIWHFASVSHRDLFQANPERYAPQFGGYCALGIAAGEYADIDPEAWTIVDGKLYFNNSKDYQKVWKKAPEAYVVTAQYNWSENRNKLRDNR
jgi:YHS domain-containing protein